MRRILAVTALALLCAAPAASATGGDDSRRFREAVTTKGILAHETALNLIGELSNGNRLAGTKGYDASALYVSTRAAWAGLKVSSQPFDYELGVLADYKQPILRVVSGGRRTALQRRHHRRDPRHGRRLRHRVRLARRPTSPPPCGRSTSTSTPARRRAATRAAARRATTTACRTARSRSSSAAPARSPPSSSPPRSPAPAAPCSSTRATRAAPRRTRPGSTSPA